VGFVVFSTSSKNHKPHSNRVGSEAAKEQVDAYLRENTVVSHFLIVLLYNTQRLRFLGRHCVYVSDHTMLMLWFRRVPDLSEATTRFSHEADINNVSRLLRDGARRYYALGGKELPLLLKNGHAVVIQYKKDILGVAVVSFRVHQTTWLRAVALARGLDTSVGMSTLLPPLHNSLRKNGLQHVFYAGEEYVDAWLLPSLRQQGYMQDTEVLVYEKRSMDIPSYGNQHVTVRPSLQGDIYSVQMLDRECFEVHWTKDDTLIGNTLSHDGIFLVAELRNRLVGYAYATSHFAGQLFHLVRIAVDPRHQGEAIGVRLLAEVVEFARLQNAQVMTLNTQAYNEQAQRIYRWFGFVATGERQPVLRRDLM